METSLTVKLIALLEEKQLVESLLLNNRNDLLKSRLEEINKEIKDLVDSTDKQ